MYDRSSAAEWFKTVRSLSSTGLDSSQNQTPIDYLQDMAQRVLHLQLTLGPVAYGWSSFPRLEQPIQGLNQVASVLYMYV